MKSPLLIAISLLFLQICHAQYFVKGKVISNAGEPLQSVNVKAEGVTPGSITDSAGNFILPVAVPAIKVEFSIAGYKTRGVIISCGLR